MIKIYINIVILGFMLGCGIYDYIYREIPVWIYILMGTCEVLIIAAGHKTNLIATIPGIVMIIYSYISEDNLGSGDGWYFLLIGLLTGIKTLIIHLVGTVFICAIFGLSLIINGKYNIKKMYLPMLTIAMIPGIIIMISGGIV